MNKIENRSEIYMGMAKKNYKTINLGVFKAEILGKPKWGVFLRHPVVFQNVKFR